jgi:hypothetical protein
LLSQYFVALEQYTDAWLTLLPYLARTFREQFPCFCDSDIRLSVSLLKESILSVIVPGATG